MVVVGVTRHIDPLGRVTIPKEIRDLFHLRSEDTLEILGTDQGISLRIPNVIVKERIKDNDEHN